MKWQKIKKIIFLCYGKVLSAKLKTFEMGNESITVEPVYEYMCDLIDKYSDDPFSNSDERKKLVFGRIGQIQENFKAWQ